MDVTGPQYLLYCHSYPSREPHIPDLRCQSISAAYRDTIHNQVYLTLNVNNNDYYIYNNSQLSQEYSFIDYIKNGVQIALSIGIDFTRSNGVLNNPNSLHRIIPGNFNDYEHI